MYNVELNTREIETLQMFQESYDVSIEFMTDESMLYFILYIIDNERTTFDKRVFEVHRELQENDNESFESSDIECIRQQFDEVTNYFQTLETLNSIVEKLKKRSCLYTEF